MASIFRFLLLAGVSLAWLIPGFQAWQVLDRLHGLEIAPDAATIRAGLESVKWTLLLMGAATAVWVLQVMTARQTRREAAELQSQLHEAQRRIEGGVEQLSDVLRRSTTELQGDFGNFTAVGTRLRSALDARLSGIEAALQRQEQARSEAMATPAADARLEERLASMEHAIDAALREVGVTVVHKLRGLEADLYERDQRAMTDFGSLDNRLSDDSERWEARLRGLEERFAELTRKTTLDGAQVTANLKLLSLRVKDLALAVQH